MTSILFTTHSVSLSLSLFSLPSLLCHLHFVFIAACCRRRCSLAVWFYNNFLFFVRPSVHPFSSIFFSTFFRCSSFDVTTNGDDDENFSSLAHCFRIHLKWKRICKRQKGGLAQTDDDDNRRREERETKT